MTEIDTLERTVIEEKVVLDKNLIVYNDDFNTFDFVIDALVKVCEHDVLQAEQCTTLIHYKGKCEVKRGSFKYLEKMCTSLLDRGITAEVE